MPQKPKPKDPPVQHEADTPNEASIVEDHNARGYYYDDAHGYQTYKPDDDVDDDCNTDNWP